MSNLVIGLSLIGVVLVWVIVRYFSAMKSQRVKVQEKVLKDQKYQRVLEKAKVAEHEEKVFKAQTGHVSSQLSLAKEFELTSISQAIFWYQKAAALDNDIAQNALARLCRLDRSDSDGEAKSKYWQQVVLAKRKEPEALYQLGYYLVSGYGTEIDTESGVEKIIAAAEQGHVEAQLFLGDWYVAEINQHKDPLVAFGWRVRAALTDEVKGCIKTAFCYQSGVGVAKDRARAIYWLERAAEMGSSEAQFLAAKMHLGSDANDAAIAYVWFSIANAFGHKTAKTERDEAAQYVGIESILAAQSVANSVFRLLKRQPVARHRVIDLMDRVYARSSYRPDEDVLASLASGELAGDTAQAEAIASRDGEVEMDLSSVASPERDSEFCDIENGVSANAEKSEGSDDSSLASETKNETATKEYQQQNWATSWDSFTAESKKSSS
ncbi:tetratricopeptide repeat protein [Photobacterium kasasachensis]|uniref:tetratricopeptide repeat protein n=1 Tax=Photobacterium kasasachensis TaxID=2910240 RepID=UPI003D0E089C